MKIKRNLNRLEFEKRLRDKVLYWENVISTTNNTNAFQYAHKQLNRISQRLRSYESTGKFKDGVKR